MSRRDEPAFPRIDGFEPSSRDDRTHVYSTGGMTLREHYAGLALQGYLAGRGGGGPAGLHRHHVARVCADYAEALLAELERRA